MGSPRLGASSRFIGLAALLIAAASASVTFAGAPERRPAAKISVVQASDAVTVAWRVRAHAEVRLRLYREHPNGSRVLVSEVTTERGVSSFEIFDDHRPPGPSTYRLAVVRHNGAETEIGTMLCIEAELLPDGTTVAPSGIQPVAAVATVVYGPDLESELVAAGAGVSRSWPAPAPDPPVPRRV